MLRNILFAFFFLGIMLPALGQQCGLLYVSPNGATSGNAGTQANPAELNYALTLLSPDIQHVYLANGTYRLNKTLSLHSDLVLEGGFDPQNNWAKTNASASIIFRTKDNPLDNPMRLVGIEGIGVKNITISDVQIIVSDATEIGFGTTVYGVYLSNSSDYCFNRCTIRAGNGADGQEGSKGADGQKGADGSNGETGQEDGGCCREGGNGGNSWSFGSFSGGKGGRGGEQGRPRSFSNPSGRAFSGDRGEDGKSNNNTHGSGSNGGQGTTETAVTGCINDGTKGMNGARGNDGRKGRGREDNAMEFDGKDGIPKHENGFFSPADGINGKNGENGGGGGGGGGGGSQGATLTQGTCGSGGGGGGGGEGGQGGQGGLGGGGGGGSFAFYVHNAGVNGVLKYCNLLSGFAGKGARGGIGGNGNIGGKGGRGGSTGQGSSCDVGMGGDGAIGGNGGSGGNGGQGADGWAQTTYFSPEGVQANMDSLNLSIQDEALITIPSNGCTHFTIPMEISASGDIIWFFGQNAEPSSAKNSKVSVKYLTTGRKTINVIVNGTAYSYSDIITIRQNGSLLNPKLILSHDTICTGMQIRVGSSISGVQYKWTINGKIIPNSESSQTIDTLTFNDEGLKIIRLQTYSECCGWSEPEEKRIWVRKGQGPSLQLQTLSGQSVFCSGEAITFIANARNAGDNPNYIWWINGQRISNTQSYFVTNTLLNGDQVQVGMICYTECSNGDPILSAPITINITAKPVLIKTQDQQCFSLIHDGDVIQPYQLIKLKIDDTNSLLNQYFWDFGNGTNGIGREVSTQFDSSGWFNVRLWAMESLGCNSEVCEQRLYVAIKTKADFSAQNTKGCMPLYVQFQNKSRFALGFSWDFGDGTAPSVEENPTHIYTRAGNYTVKLIANGVNNIDSTTLQQGIVVFPYPKADFMAYNTFLYRSKDTAEFASSSLGAEKWKWDFGDESTMNDTSSLPNPKYFYGNEGQYTVRLIVENEFGCSDTMFRRNYITKKIDRVGRENENLISIRIYPNPAKEDLTLSWYQEEDNWAKVSLYDTKGSEIILIPHQNISMGEQVYQLKIPSGLVSGVYGLNIQIGDDVYYRLIVIE